MMCAIPECENNEELAFCLCSKHYHSMYDRARHLDLRIKALEILGNKCRKCGEQNLIVLQIDHISGGGRTELRKISTRGVYRKILKGETGGYQLLCANCNTIKKYENNETRR